MVDKLGVAIRRLTRLAKNLPVLNLLLACKELFWVEVRPVWV